MYYVSGPIWFINLLFILAVIFVERKRPQTTIAWVLVMSFLPVIGIVVYIFVGNSALPSFGAKIKRSFLKYDAYTKDFYDYIRKGQEEINDISDEKIKKYTSLLNLNLKNNGSLYCRDNDVKIYTSAKEKYDDLINDIMKAEKNINLEYFIIRPDEVGKRLIDALAKKAAEGVEVKLLYDPLGSISAKKKFFAPLKEAGGKVEMFLTTVPANIYRFNNRNHRKIAVIDGKIGYTGGMNIGREYMGLGKIPVWRDTHIRVVGSGVYMLQIRFLLDWIFSQRKNRNDLTAVEFEKYFPEKIESSGDIGMQIVSSGPDSPEEEIKYGLFKMINDAKDHIYIQTPYFVPDEALFEALKIAASSGVDVKIIIPGTADKEYVYMITKSYVEDLMPYGVKVYAHKGFIHSKTIVIDSAVTSIGTTNFDVRSFALNFEINAFLFSEDFAKENERIFNEDLKDCRELSLTELKSAGVIYRSLQSIFRLFAPLA